MRISKNNRRGGPVRLRAGFLAAGLAIAAMPALAADAVEAPPEPPMAAPVFEQPAPAWSGFYAGAFLGYNFGTFDADGGDIDADGFGGGVFLGGNNQIGSIVYGAELDAGYSGADGTLAGVDARQTWNGSLRARLGYDFSPVLVYGTAGVAMTQAEVTAGADSDTNTHVGWTVGAGADAMLTESIFGRVEYRYTDYAAKDYTLGATTVSSGFNDHSIKAGIGLKF